ncbi:UNVERIFIED_CONTAM: reverse transcriptase family protein [Halobacillus marinus]
MSFYIYQAEQIFQQIIKENKSNIVGALKNKNDAYEKIEIPKNNGSRTIYCLKRDSKLKLYQKHLLSNFLSEINISDQTYGFVKERSYKDFFRPHLNTNPFQERYYLRIDIRDFFETITKQTIKEELSFFLKIKNPEEKEETLDIISEIVTLNDFLPQGAITSPTLSNIVFREFDIKINKYSERLGVVYTRYADDLLFSSSKDHKRFAEPLIKMIYKIINKKNFSVNHKKTIRATNQINLNGFVVGENIRLSRKRKKDINNIIHHYIKAGRKIEVFLNEINKIELIYRHKKFNSLGSVINFLNGYRAFLIDWKPVNVTDKNISKHNEKIDTLEEIVRKAEKCY